MYINGYKINEMRFSSELPKYYYIPRVMNKNASLYIINITTWDIFMYCFTNKASTFVSYNKPFASPNDITWKYFMHKASSHWRRRRKQPSYYAWSKTFIQGEGKIANTLLQKQGMRTQGEPFQQPWFHFSLDL